MDSIWTQINKPRSFDRLTTPEQTDILIIGGGMAGILCAYMFHQANIPYLLVEANAVVLFVSTRSEKIRKIQILRIFLMMITIITLRAFRRNAHSFTRSAQAINSDTDTLALNTLPSNNLACGQLGFNF